MLQVYPKCIMIETLLHQMSWLRRFRVHFTRLLPLVGLGLFIYLQYPGYPNEEHNPIATTKPQTRRNPIDPPETLARLEVPSKPVTPVIQKEEITANPATKINTSHKHMFDIYEPTCPPHPTIEHVKAPYGYIPEGMRRESRIVCEGKNSRIRLYPGQVIELDNVILDFNQRSFSGGYSFIQPGFLLVDCEIQGSDFMVEPITRSVQQVDDIRKVTVEYDQLDPAVVSARDDCGNVWHAMADFLRVFTAGYVANTKPSERSVW